MSGDDVLSVAVEDFAACSFNFSKCFFRLHETE